jgi:hypothetical protein
MGRRSAREDDVAAEEDVLAAVAGASGLGRPEELPAAASSVLMHAPSSFAGAIVYQLTSRHNAPSLGDGNVMKRVRAIHG